MATRNPMISAFLQRYVVMLLLGVLVVFFSILSPSFMKAENLSYVFTHNSSLIIMAVGLSFIMVGGGIDLSLGYQVSLCSVITGYLLANGASTPLAVGIAIATGIACGALNAVIIIFLKIPPFAATLATQLIFRAAANIISSGRAYTQLPSPSHWFIGQSLFGLSSYFWITLLCLLLYGLVFSLTSFGTYLKAMGENELAVGRIGIKVRWVKFLSYTIGSFFFSIQALILTFSNGIASPSTGTGLEIVAITVVFLGCSSLLRNESTNILGPILHLIAGVMILAILENGMLLAGWNLNIQYLVRGVLLIFAIAFYYRRKVESIVDDEP